jgi:hypothetical protein
MEYAMAKELTDDAAMQRLRRLIGENLSEQERRKLFTEEALEDEAANLAAIKSPMEYAMTRKLNDDTNADLLPKRFRSDNCPKSAPRQGRIVDVGRRSICQLAS